MAQIKHKSSATHPNNPAKDVSKNAWEEEHNIGEGTARIYSGLDANKPAFGFRGSLFFATDTGIIYKDTGLAWEEIIRSESATRLNELIEKSHNSLTGVTENQHHTKFIITEHDTPTRHALGSVVPHDELALLEEQSHDSLTNVTEDQHHTKMHGDEQHSPLYEQVPNKGVASGYCGLNQWLYRKLHTIVGQAGAGNYYQIQIKVNYGSGVDSGMNVYCNSKCKTDFSDIRFTDNDGITLLDYWMEQRVDSSYAVFWVEVTDSLESSVNIYIYYGNTNAGLSTTSNEGATAYPNGGSGYANDFEPSSSFFNVLESPWIISLDRAQSPIHSVKFPYMISDGVKHDVYRSSTIVYPSGKVVRQDCFWLNQALSADELIWGFQVSGVWRGPQYSINGGVLYYNNGGTNTSLGYTVPLQQWVWIKAIIDPSNNRYNLYTSTDGITWTIRGTNLNYCWAISGGTACNVLIRSYRSGTANPLSLRYIDDEFWRKYVDPEPTHGSWNGEENVNMGNGPTGDILISLDNISTTLTGKTCPRDKMETVIIKADGSGDYASLQAALDAGEPEIFLADGTYILTQEAGATSGIVEFKTAQQRIFGSRKAIVKIASSAGPAYFIYCNYANCGIYGITLDGNSIGKILVYATASGANFRLIGTKISSYYAGNAAVAFSCSGLLVFNNRINLLGGVTSSNCITISDNGATIFGNYFKGQGVAYGETGVWLNVATGVNIFGNTFDNIQSGTRLSSSSARAYIWGNNYITVTYQVYNAVNAIIYLGYPECGDSSAQANNQLFNYATRNQDMDFYKILNPSTDSFYEFDCDVPDMATGGLGHTITLDYGAARIELAAGDGNYGYISQPASSVALTVPTNFPFSKAPQFAISLYVPKLANGQEIYVFMGLQSGVDPSGTNEKAFGFHIRYNATAGQNYIRAFSKNDSTTSYGSDVAISSNAWHVFYSISNQQYGTWAGGNNSFLIIDGGASTVSNPSINTQPTGAWTDMTRCLIQIYARTVAGSALTVDVMKPLVRLQVLP